MVIFKNRIAPKHEIFQLFFVCMFPIHLWSFFNLAWKIPSFLLRMSFSELIGTVAYIQVYTLAEGILFFILMFILGMIVPAKFFRAKYLYLGTLYIILTSIWVLILHFIPNLVTFIIYKTGYANVQLILGFLLWILIFGYIIILKTAYRLVHRGNITYKINDIVDRIVVLTSLYLVFDVLSIFIVIIRNIM